MPEETKTIRLRHGHESRLTDGDEEMALEVAYAGGGRPLIATYLAPDEIGQLIEALAEEPHWSDPRVEKRQVTYGPWTAVEEGS